MSGYKNISSTHKGIIRPVEQVSMVNPYKYEKKDSEWEKICKKYDEEDKSKLKKEEKDNNE
tara:strand:- start:1066 stop:1248 length:183 start_codon:yes stop_codon:yes gene_type:complete